MKRIFWYLLVLIVLGAIGYMGYALRANPQPVKISKSANVGSRKPKLVQKGAEAGAIAKPVLRTARNRKGKDMKVFSARSIAVGDDGIYRDENGRAYPERDQKLMRRSAEAITNDDIEEARSVAEKAVDSQNRELRLMAVDALGWFRKDNLVELMSFLCDRDAEVAEKARDEWMAGLQEMDNDSNKAWIIKSCLSAIRDKELIEDVANELIGIDELAAIQVIADTITDNKNYESVNAVKEVYNTITGEDWSDIDAAEDWLQENYTSEEGE